MSIQSKFKPITVNELENIHSDNLDIIMIADRSGSMWCVRESMLDAINKTIAEQKQFSLDYPEKKAKISIITFNETYTIIRDREDVATSEPILPEDYITNGCTALYKTLIKILIDKKHLKNVIVVIVTDGVDTMNDSLYTKQLSNDIITERKNDGWKFIYLSTDVETSKQGDCLGIVSSPSIIKSTGSNNIVVEYNLMAPALYRSCSGAISCVRIDGHMPGMGDNYTQIESSMLEPVIQRSKTTSSLVNPLLTTVNVDHMQNNNMMLTNFTEMLSLSMPTLSRSNTLMS
jgi:hypothetical protein